jgi:hypothetical protein
LIGLQDRKAIGRRRGSDGTSHSGKYEREQRKDAAHGISPRTATFRRSIVEQVARIEQRRGERHGTLSGA